MPSNINIPPFKKINTESYEQQKQQDNVSAYIAFAARQQATSSNVVTLASGTQLPYTVTTDPIKIKFPTVTINNGKLSSDKTTFNVEKDGNYQILINISFTETAATPSVRCVLRVNGASNVQTIAPVFNNQGSFNILSIVKLANSDTIDVMLSSAADTYVLSSYISILKV